MVEIPVMLKAEKNAALKTDALLARKVEYLLLATVAEVALLRGMGAVMLKMALIEGFPEAPTAEMLTMEDRVMAPKGRSVVMAVRFLSPLVKARYNAGFGANEARLAPCTSMEMVKFDNPYGVTGGLPELEVDGVGAEHCQ